MLIRCEKWDQIDRATQAECLARPASANDPELRRSVEAIVSKVRDNGDTALRELTARFDGVELGDLAVDDDELAAAEREIGVAAVTAIDVAITNVRTFHEAQVPAPLSVETTPGVVCERVTHPLDAVGLYVPAGTAPLPSAAIMLGVPAATAGCPTRIMCTPPRRDGRADPAVVVAAHRAGITDLFKIGGAQAIAAMAYGTETITRVGKIFGPGNTWVTCAKSVVSADPDGAAIDLPAGPSEVLVIADELASPAFVAADLLSQAEHGADSQVVLLTNSDALGRAVTAEIERQLPSLSRRAIAERALAHARILIVESMDQAIEISNRYAPEHLILQCQRARSLLPAIRNAGSVFLGQWTPESVGDYCSGTNHVLPTNGHARSYSGLGVDQFLRQMSVQELTREGLVKLADTIETLAGLEGLDAHAAAVTVRLEGRP